MVLLSIAITTATITGYIHPIISLSQDSITNRLSLVQGCQHLSETSQRLIVAHTAAWACSFLTQDSL